MYARGYNWRLSHESALGDDEAMNTSTRRESIDVARLKELYPALSGDQLIEVERRLMQYVSIVQRLVSYLEANPTAYPQLSALQKALPDLRSDSGGF